MIYLDMDGVLADYFGEITRRCGGEFAIQPMHLPYDQWTDEQKRCDVIVREQMERDDFWDRLPVMPKAHELVAAAATRGATFILTASPRVTEHRERIAYQKREWADKFLHFPVGEVIVCERQDKVHWAMRRVSDHERSGGHVVTRNILIDDSKANCDEWTAAGGIAHQFTNPDAAIAFLKELNL